MGLGHLRRRQLTDRSARSLDPVEDLSYEGLTASLRSAYDKAAERRENKVKGQWKLDEREAFAERMLAEEKSRLLEVGAGTGNDGEYFVSRGLHLVATDLSAEHVRFCRAKGLEAYEMDFLHLDFPDESFDAINAMLCLLHVPDADLSRVLASLKRVLVRDGLLFVGVYGGHDEHGSHTHDDHDPPRYFAFRSDEQMRRALEEHFEIVDFHTVAPDDFYFQSFTVRKT